MPQLLTLIYYPTENSKIEFQVNMTKEDLLSKMYLVSSTTSSSRHKRSTEEEKQAIQKDMKDYFLKSKTKTYCCCFWSTPQPTFNITILKLGRNTPRNIYTDFSNDVIDITAWVKKNNITSDTLQTLFVDENQKSLMTRFSFQEPIHLKGVEPVSPRKPIHILDITSLAPSSTPSVRENFFKHFEKVWEGSVSSSKPHTLGVPALSQFGTFSPSRSSMSTRTVAISSSSSSFLPHEIKPESKDEEHTVAFEV